jgi:molybdenum cofactor cytidylyltransferase
MAESVRAGLGAVGRAATGVFICLCDHPLVAPSTLKTMGGKHGARPDAIIIPVFEGRRGHPTLFPRFVLEEIEKCNSLRELVESYKDGICFVEVGDEGVVLDMDTPEEYRKILGKLPIGNSPGATSEVIA